MCLLCGLNGMSDPQMVLSCPDKDDCDVSCCVDCVESCVVEWVLVTGECRMAMLGTDRPAGGVGVATSNDEQSRGLVGHPVQALL